MKELQNKNRCVTFKRYLSLNDVVPFTNFTYYSSKSASAHHLIDAPYVPGSAECYVLYCTPSSPRSLAKGTFCKRREMISLRCHSWWVAGPELAWWLLGYRVWALSQHGAPLVLLGVPRTFFVLRGLFRWR